MSVQLLLQKLKPQPAKCLECCSDSDVVNNVANGLLEANALYNLAGYIVRVTKKRICANCYAALNSIAALQTADATYTNYLNRGGMTKTKENITAVFEIVEQIFVIYKPNISEIHNPITFLTNIFFSSNAYKMSSPSSLCCLSILVKRYFKVRIHIHGDTISRKFISQRNLHD